MKNKASADTLEFNTNYTGPKAMNRSLGKLPYDFYKVALLFNDFFLSMLVYSGCALVLIEDIDLIHNFSHSVTIIIFALASIAFFHFFTLYNYHIIYDAKRHKKLLAKTWVWNAFILFSVFIIHTYGNSAADFEITVATVTIAILLMLLKKVH